MGLVWHAVLILLFMWYAGIVHTNKGRNPHPTRRKNEQLRMLLLRPQQSNSQRHLRPLPQKTIAKTAYTSAPTAKASSAATTATCATSATTSSATNTRNDATSAATRSAKIA